MASVPAPCCSRFCTGPPAVSSGFVNYSLCSVFNFIITVCRFVYLCEELFAVQVKYLSVRCNYAGKYCYKKAQWLKKDCFVAGYWAAPLLLKWPLLIIRVSLLLYYYDLSTCIWHCRALFFKQSNILQAVFSTPFPRLTAVEAHIYIKQEVESRMKKKNHSEQILPTLNTERSHFVTTTHRGKKGKTVELGGL
jgi:hypothetical protein